MEEKEYNSHIHKAKNNICHIRDIAKTCDNNENWISLLDDAINWINEFETDFEKKIIPDSYLTEIDEALQPLLYDRSEQADEEIKESIKGHDVGEFNWKNRQPYSLKDFLNQADSYRFYKQLNFAQSNAVVVGANGCGKTTLANTLFKSLRATNGIVIPAQKLLIIPSYSSIPTYSNVSKEYNDYQYKVLDDKQTYNMSQDNSIPYQIMRQYGCEFRNIISTLIAEQVSKNNAYCISVKKKRNF